MVDYFCDRKALSQTGHQHWSNYYQSPSRLPLPLLFSPCSPNSASHQSCTPDHSGTARPRGHKLVLARDKTMGLAHRMHHNPRRVRTEKGMYPSKYQLKSKTWPTCEKSRSILQMRTLFFVSLNCFGSQHSLRTTQVKPQVPASSVSCNQARWIMASRSGPVPMYLIYSILAIAVQVSTRIHLP